ncbi:MAG: nicotinate-nucleotide adenylyltransferase [Anaerolineales bacterium]|jgi:nicotinate-nucleotide adenylyltransferase
MAGLEPPLRLGVFGGTFDPPHHAHRILAAEALEQLNLARVLWVLTPNPPHKVDVRITPLEHRLAMLQAALAGEDRFELSHADIDRPPPHYALGTLQALRSLYPHARLVFLMGGDSLRDLPTWHAAQAFLQACDELGVMQRASGRLELQALEQVLPGLQAKLRWIETPRIEISASWIRERIHRGKTYRYYIPQAVFEIIEKRGLFK